MEYTWYQAKLDAGWIPPVEFVNDFVLETSRIHSENHERTVKEAFGIIVADRPRDLYHQKMGKGQSNSEE